MSTRISRACDGCRFRKVRCSGAHPCAQCAHLNLPCIFTPAPAKRKPGVRGRLVAQLRGKTTLKNVPSESSASGSSSVARVARPDPGGHTLIHKSLAPAIHELPSYPPEFFLGLLPEFEQHVYPVNPIVTADDIRESVSKMSDSFEDAALVYIFAATTINLTRTSSARLHGAIAEQITDLVQRSLAAHRQAELRGVGVGVLAYLPVSIKRIMTCIFHEMCMMAFRRYDRCFIILREAIAMIDTLNIHKYSADGSDLQHRVYVAKCQRLYWEAYIHERFLCIASGFPCSMDPLKTGFPSMDPSIPLHIHVGFNRLIHLFQTMDNTFLERWSSQQDPGGRIPDVTAEWIEHKQSQLDGDELGAAEAERELMARAEGGRSGLSEVQRVDLFVTRLWLRTLVWQLALSKGLLRSSPPQNTHEGLSLHFPAERLSAQLHNLVSRLECVASIGTHGSGILQKLFEITSTVADVLALPLGVGQTEEEARARIENFMFLAKFLFSFERTEKEKRDYLRDKLITLQQMYTAVNFDSLASRSPD